MVSATRARRSCHRAIATTTINRTWFGAINLAILNCLSLSQSLSYTFIELVMVKKFRICCWTFDAIYDSSKDVIISGFWLPYRYFRLSVPVEITCQHFLSSTCCKPEICRWNNNAVAVNIGNCNHLDRRWINASAMHSSK